MASEGSTLVCGRAGAVVGRALRPIDEDAIRKLRANFWRRSAAERGQALARKTLPGGAPRAQHRLKTRHEGIRRKSTRSRSCYPLRTPRGRPTDTMRRASARPQLTRRAEPPPAVVRSREEPRCGRPDGAVAAWDLTHTRQLTIDPGGSVLIWSSSGMNRGR